MGRRLERIELKQTIHVFDTINNNNIGEVVNLTTEGMMLMCHTELTPGSIFQFALEPPQGAGISTIFTGTDCLWVTQFGESERYWVGFQIIDASEEAIASITTLIKDYGIASAG